MPPADSDAAPDNPEPAEEPTPSPAPSDPASSGAQADSGQAPDSAPVVMPAKRLPKKKGLIWLIAGIVALLLVGGALAYYMVSKNSNNAATTVPPSTTTSTNSSSTTTPATTASCNKTSTMYVVATAGLRVHSSKSDTATVVTTMPWGAKVTAGCDDGTWSVVTYQGQTDYAQTQYMATTDPSIFKIKEYNVQFKITADLADLTYAVKDTGDGGSAAYFTSNGLLAIDKACTTDVGSLGAVGKYTPDAPYHDTTASQAGVPAIGDYYYIYESAQSLCSENSSATKLETTQLNSLKTAIKSLEASQ